jgi:hypothetical protein
MLDLFRLRNDIHELDAGEKLTPKQKLDIFAPKIMTVFSNLYGAWIIDESKPGPTTDLDILITQCNSLIYYTRAKQAFSQKMATMVSWDLSHIFYWALPPWRPRRPPGPPWGHPMPRQQAPGQAAEDQRS